MKKSIVKKIFKVCLLILICILLVPIVLWSLLFINVNDICIDGDFLRTYKANIVNKDNEIIHLVGFNIGNWLVPEGWLGVTEIDGQDDNTDGKKLTYLKLINALKNNPNDFTDVQINELLNIYYSNWFTENDVKWIKDNGFNCIRLPFLYYNLFNDNDLKQDAFKYIDLCLEWCEKYSIYCILDCHGALGSQNKEHHSGDDTKADLYSNEFNRQQTTKMWEAIADRYKNNTWVAAYDLLNEPTDGKGFTDKIQWEYYDELYDAIKKVDPNHIMIMESCWDYKNLPNPIRYKWKNVVYSYHDYFDANIIVDYIKRKKRSSFIYGAKTVPIYIGEFALGNNKDNLYYLLDYYNENEFSYTMWTYKSNTSKDWSVFNLNKSRVNIDSADFEEIATAWENTDTDFFSVSDAAQNYLNYHIERR